MSRVKLLAWLTVSMLLVGAVALVSEQSRRTAQPSKVAAPTSATIVSAQGGLVAGVVVFDDQHVLLSDSTHSELYTITDGKVSVKNGPSVDADVLKELAKRAKVLTVIETSSQEQVL